VIAERASASMVVPPNGSASAPAWVLTTWRPSMMTREARTAPVSHPPDPKAATVPDDLSRTANPSTGATYLQPPAPKAAMCSGYCDQSPVGADPTSHACPGFGDDGGSLRADSSTAPATRKSRTCRASLSHKFSFFTEPLPFAGEVGLVRSTSRERAYALKIKPPSGAPQTPMIARAAACQYGLSQSTATTTATGT